MGIQCSGMLATTTCHHCRNWIVRYFICFGHNLQFRCDLIMLFFTKSSRYSALNMSLTVLSSSYDYRSCVLLCSEIFRISNKSCFVFLYWLGVWGVSTSAVRLDHVPLGNDRSSWVLTSDGTTVHNNEVIS